mmetsp:Transcript_33856/g.71016  ORF Transcript_33856/g.71016 Transcript_33856/m.71016 type:complete len:205 (+) Transcript_33856:546-1160(+)
MYRILYSRELQLRSAAAVFTKKSDPLTLFQRSNSRLPASHPFQHRRIRWARRGRLLLQGRLCGLLGHPPTAGRRPARGAGVVRGEPLRPAHRRRKLQRGDELPLRQARGSDADGRAGALHRAAELGQDAGAREDRVQLRGAALRQDGGDREHRRRPHRVPQTHPGHSHGQARPQDGPEGGDEEDGAAARGAGAYQPPPAPQRDT